MPNAVHEVRIGLIKATVRRATTRSGVRHTVSVVRLYRNGDLWKQSTRFGRDDLPVVRLALDEAYTWVLTKTHQQRSTTAADVDSATVPARGAAHHERR
jgi:hypothetical protein